jgi:hypothetical protein
VFHLRNANAKPLEGRLVPSATWLRVQTDRKYNRNNKIIASFFIVQNLLIVIRADAFTGPVARDFSL